MFQWLGSHWNYIQNTKFEFEMLFTYVEHYINIYFIHFMINEYKENPVSCLFRAKNFIEFIEFYLNGFPLNCYYFNNFSNKMNLFTVLDFDE